MANSDGQVRIIIDTNANEAVKALDDTSKAFDKSAKSAREASTVYQSFELENTQLIERLREIALAGGQNGNEFKRLASIYRDNKKALEEADSAVQKATGGLRNQQNGMSSLINAGKSLIAGYVGIQGAIKAFHFAMESVDAFRVQERAIASLNTTLKNTGVYTAEYSANIQKLASEIQGYSNYGDEAIIKAQALGQSFAGQVPFTENATKAVVDFAAATGMDLEQAFTLVGKSIGSNTNALGRYGVELQKGMTDSQKMEAITKQLGDRYKGQAAQMADAGTQLKNSIGDMKESFGAILNGYVTNWQSGMNKMVQATTSFINRIRVMHAEVSSLSTADLEKRYNKNAQKIAQYAGAQTRGSYELLKREAALKAENNLILQQIKYIKEQQKVAQNVKPIKFTDETPITSSGISTGAVSMGINKSGQTQQIKDDYEKLQEAVQNARREVELTAIKYGTSSDEVRVKFQQFKKATEELSAIDKIFDEQKIEQPKTKFEELNQKIAETKARLQELYLSEGQSENFFIAKNELSALETQVQDMNTAISNRVGLDWQNVSNSIRSNLTSALTTPLQQGESAFQRLQTIGLNAVQLVGQEIIKYLLEQIKLQSILKALGTAFSFLGGGAVGDIGSFALSANGNVFQNGNVIPFAKGGVVDKPTIFPMANGGTGLMGEAGAEAVMPLRRMSNGRLGVEASSENGKAVQVNIYNQSNSQVETRQRNDGGMDIIIKRVNEALMNERTSSGFRAAYQREDRKGLQAV